MPCLGFEPRHHHPQGRLGVHSVSAAVTMHNNKHSAPAIITNNNNHYKSAETLLMYLRCWLSVVSVQTLYFADTALTSCHCKCVDGDDMLALGDSSLSD